MKCATCDFESGRCGWKDTSIGAFVFYRDQVGNIQSITQTPSGDATTSSSRGYVLYMDQRPSDFLTNATIETVALGATGLACQVQFSVYIGGNQIDKSEISVVNKIIF